jgi:phosphoribosylformylglycinamidine cyclo-ligase
MCVNDVVCLGVKPAFFLDYIATSKLVPTKVALIVKGIADGCALAGCALIGGETAEMPGFYKENEYDVAGFSVGIVEKDKIIDGSRITGGDILIGISSSGVHSNGFSLIRKIFNIGEDIAASFDKLSFYSDELGATFAEELLKPTKIYISSVMKLLEGGVEIKGISHITGGGFVENVPRMLPKGFRAVVNKSSFDVLPIFDVIQRSGKLSNDDMFETFNMGIGLVLAVAKADVDKALEILERHGEKSYIIGEVKPGDNGIDIL